MDGYSMAWENSCSTLLTPANRIRHRNSGSALEYLLVRLQKKHMIDVVVVGCEVMELKLENENKEK